ncbi:MAG: response regulator [Bryobacteraceae bacterium]|nr:response regulator [Bryobacteraceae bacterium]
MSFPFIRESARSEQALPLRLGGGPSSAPDEESGAAPARAKQAPAASLPEQAGRRNVRLLIVEDNPTDIVLIRQAIQLHDVPVEITLAEDGEAALRLIDEAERSPEAACPEVILLDLNLPRRDGHEILRRARASERCKRIPIVVFTSSDSQRDRALTASLGATRYFRKPVDYLQFLEIGSILRDVIEEYRRTN